MPLQGCIDMQAVKRVSGRVMREQTVYAEHERETEQQATTGFCLYLGGRFEVDRQGDIWVERPGTLRPIKRTKAHLSQTIA